MTQQQRSTTHSSRMGSQQWWCGSQTEQADDSSGHPLPQNQAALNPPPLSSPARPCSTWSSSAAAPQSSGSATQQPPAGPVWGSAAAHVGWRAQTDCARADLLPANSGCCARSRLPANMAPLCCSAVCKEPPPSPPTRPALRHTHHACIPLAHQQVDTPEVEHRHHLQQQQQQHAGSGHVC